MEELGKIVQLLGSLPVVLGGLLLVYLILRIPAVGSLLAKKLGGHDKNGAPKTYRAGDATIDYWKSTTREIVEGALEDHEKIESNHFEDLGRRYGDLREALRELSQVLRDNQTEQRNGNQQIVQALNGLQLTVRLHGRDGERS